MLSSTPFIPESNEMEVYTDEIPRFPFQPRSGYEIFELKPDTYPDSNFAYFASHNILWETLL